LLRALVAQRVLEPEPGGSGEYRATARLREFAQAHIVPTLTRAEAKDVVERACAWSERHNAVALRNPLFIERLAVSGDYMNAKNDLTGRPALWASVGIRDRRAAPPALTESQGAHEIRAGLRELAPHVVAQIVPDLAPIERPFGVPFEAGNELPSAP